VTAADRPYGEFYDFYSISPENFGKHPVNKQGIIIYVNFNTWRKLLKLKKFSRKPECKLVQK